MWTESELAYFAAIFDTCSCITIVRKNLIYQQKTLITTHKKRLIEWIEQRFKGKIYIYVQPNLTLRYQWSLSASLLQTLLPKLIPYLIITREKTEIILKFRGTFSDESKILYSKEELLSQRLSLFNEIRLIKDN